MVQQTTTRDIVAKLWNLCHILRDDGVTYNEYVTELTFLLFLKMMAETGREDVLPNGYRWSQLTKRTGLEQLDYYKRLLLDLGTKGKARVAAIFADATAPHSMTVSKLALREGRRFPDLIPLLLEGTAERFTRPLAAYLDARKRAGDVRDIDPLEAASMCIDLILAEITLSICTDTAISPARIDACVARITDFTLRGIAVC